MLISQLFICILVQIFCLHHCLTSGAFVMASGRGIFPCFGVGKVEWGSDIESDRASGKTSMASICHEKLGY